MSGKLPSVPQTSIVPTPSDLLSQAIDNIGTNAPAAVAGAAAFLYFFGEPVKEVIGLAGFDWLHHLRLRRLAGFQAETEKVNKRRGIVEPHPIPLRFAGPLLEAALLEDQNDLKALWAELCSAAMDPKRSGKVRKRYIETLKEFDPPDALVFKYLNDEVHWADVSHFLGYLCEKTKLAASEISISLMHLNSLHCIESWKGLQSQNQPKLTEYGSELLRLLLD